MSQENRPFDSFFLQILQQLPLDPLKRVIDGFDLTVQTFRDLLVAFSVQEQFQDLRFQLGKQKVQLRTGPRAKMDTSTEM